EHVCSATLAGQTHEYRRHLLKTLLDEAWRFSNWLTHAKASAWHDAEAATTTVEHTLGLATSLVLRHVRGVPRACPAVARHGCRRSAASMTAYPISNGRGRS